MKNVNLYYPSSVYNATTLKQEVFSWLKFEKKKEILQDVHALKDFDLEVSQGERLGVIGCNGAGKSTLLKAIAGLYPVKTGTIETRGKIRPMFELSLGFDVESTGRDNILYRGLMLGGIPAEVRAKEQEIIDFADLGAFIDFPVRAYSSGMLVRLAFAISTCVEGDILLVDEIIGAGDAAFQKKAKERMMGVINKANIMVIVLHDMLAINELCNRVILLDGGRIVADGDPKEVTDFYLNKVNGG